MHRRARLALAAAWGLMGAGALVVPGAVAQPAARDGAATRVAAEEPPALSVRRAARSVEVEKYGRRVYLDLGAFLVAGNRPVEVRTVRPAYHRPLRSTIYLGDEAFSVPADMVHGFGGARLVRLTLRNLAGEVVSTSTASMCADGEGGSVRVRPDAPDVSPYAGTCWGYHRLSLGSVNGLQAGWGRPLSSGRGAELPLGRYVAEVSIRGVYRKLLGLPAASSSTKIRVRVVRGEDGCDHCAGRAGKADLDGTGVPARPDGSARTLAAPPAGAPLPDLRSLPAFEIQMNRGRWLTFAANVWNGGESPLVVDGFRREREDVMDAYQYFYDADGNPAGRVPTGTMEWDARDGHMHWHFLDFARYRLLDADKQAIVRSRKEAFCLANTDAIDYTLPEANWNPYNTDLHSACGGYGSIAVREVLDVGSGDTYMQYLPGQSFNVENLPAGKYFIEVTGNPTRNLAESDTTNNTAYRPVWISGEPGERRKVRVRPVGLVDIG